MRIRWEFLLLFLLLGCVTEDHKPRFPQEITNNVLPIEVDSAQTVSEQGLGYTRKSTIHQSVTDAELLSAIDSVRGINIRDISHAEKMRIGKQLDAAWRTLETQPTRSKELLREALLKETEDDFFLIDLSELYLRLDLKPSEIDDVPRWLIHADPNAYADAYFHMTSRMSVLDRESWKQLVLRMLELDQLESYIVKHALSVDLDMGLLFTVVPYGEEIVPEVTARLNSPSCVVRANAAYTLGMLLPPVIPSKIETMAASDGCDRACHSSMRSLAIADPPALFRVLDKQMSDGQQSEQRELMAILEALSLAPPRQAIPYLEKLSRDNDNVVAQAAATTLEAFRVAAKGDWTPRLSSLKDAQARSQLLRDLNMAVEKKRFESSIAPSDMIALLQDEDYSLLNKARVPVLRRLSDECLYEFAILHAATLSFREAKRLHK